MPIAVASGPAGSIWGKAGQAQCLDSGPSSLHHNSHISASGPGLHCIRSSSSDWAVLAAGLPLSANGMEEFYIWIGIGYSGPLCAGDKHGSLLAALAGAGFARLYSLDYLPVLPWFGVVLYDVGLGGLLYPGYRWRLSLLDRSTVSGCSWIRLLCYLGRNSLAIYLVHQPLIILFLILAGSYLFPVLAFSINPQF